MRLNCLNFIVRSFLLLALFALLYVFFVALPKSYRAFHNLAMLLVWAYLFVSFTNLLINYNPLIDSNIIEPSDNSGTSSLTSNLHGLASKVDEWIKEKGYLEHGITFSRSLSNCLPIALICHSTSIAITDATSMHGSHSCASMNPSICSSPPLPYRLIESPIMQAFPVRHISSTPSSPAKARHQVGGARNTVETPVVRDQKHRAQPTIM